MPAGCNEPRQVRDSRTPIELCEYPGLGRQIGVLATICYHRGMGRQMVEIEPERPILNSAGSGLWVTTEEAVGRIRAAELQVAEACEAAAAELLSHAERLRQLPLAVIPADNDKGDDHDRRDQEPQPRRRERGRREAQEAG